MRTSISATLILALTRLFVKLTVTQTDGAVVVDIQQIINPLKITAMTTDLWILLIVFSAIVNYVGGVYVGRHWDED
ncbi:hypothetical protein [uncultured Prevotella sp.]|jgi:hypothetical protein|uniref:hypothetical protein n=1 Tax=uncultured Prevotella sp. TaxID=159272 RepID=UPI0025D5CF57|nr:hypothetical protein [uncultured Prevotella sp.]